MNFENDSFTSGVDGITEIEDHPTLEDTVHLPPLNQPNEI